MSRMPYREHRLPFSFAEVAHYATETPTWVSRFAGLHSEAIANSLRDEWEGIRSPSVRSFRNAILAFEPAALVYHYGKPSGCPYEGWWLKMKGPRNVNGWDTQVYLHPPTDSEVLDDFFNAHNFAEADVVREFCLHFSSMLNSFVYSTGFCGVPLPRVDVTPGLYDDIGADPHPDPRKDWASAFYFYTTDTGDWVLIKPNGEVAWLLLAARRIEPMAPSFSEFIEQCALCYRAYGVLQHYEVWDQLRGAARGLEEDG